MPVERETLIRENSRIPALDLFFAFGPMMPLVVCASASLVLPELGATFARQATVIWGGAILLFLSGVRRGLSFRTENGPTFAQLATMILLFCFGVAGLTALWFGWIKIALILLFSGYTMVLVFDPIAAERGEAPLHFKMLRVLQIPIALGALAMCFCSAMWS